MKLEVPKELRDLVEENQIRLKNAIIVHQSIYGNLRKDQNNEDLQRKLTIAEQEVINFGLEQKVILQRLRSELGNQAKVSQKNICRNVIEEKKQHLSSNLVRSRKQKIAPKTSPKPSCSDESNEDSANSSSPRAVKTETPELLAQIQFLRLLSLTTLESFKEMQNKRVERKRRTTANPNFIYENDLQPKRRKNHYPSSVSPPNTRQAVKKKNGRGSPPTEKNNDERIKLTQRVSSESISEVISESTNDELFDELSSSICNVCKDSSGVILQCEICLEGFHENCEEVSFMGTSKRCSRCTNKKKSKKNAGVLELVEESLDKNSEKIVEKQKLQDHNENLCAQLTELQERHSQLSISLKNQKVRQEELLSDRQSTQEKISCILNVIEAVKKSPMPDVKAK